MVIGRWQTFWPMSILNFKINYLFIAFSCSSRILILLACLSPGGEIWDFFCLDWNLATPKFFFQGLLASFSSSSATPFLFSFVASFVVVNALGFSLSCVYTDSISQIRECSRDAEWTEIFWAGWKQIQASKLRLIQSPMWLTFTLWPLKIQV